MSVAPAPYSPIQVRALDKRYGQMWAVRSLDLEVHTGEVFALLGPNGAGKTTTVEILEGIRRRSSGDVRVLGQDPGKGSRAWRARVGIVPQTTGAFPELTVCEVVAHFATFYPDPLPVDGVIEMVGLTGQRKKQSSALSGGQRRRLDVAIGILGDPDVIFLDEPTTGLDPVARHEAWDLVRYFAAEGKTTLLTTHYLEEAETLADRAGVIIAGSLVKIGPPGELGGPSSRLSTVSFAMAGGLAGRPLPRMPPGTQVGPAGSGRDGHVHLQTPAPTALMEILIGWAHAADVPELPDLSVHRPTLEDVYLGLIREYGAITQEAVA
jgi:ABC-2 type transport system ATP-binding protein